MSIYESIFIALFLFVIVLFAIFCLYLFIKIFSFLMEKFQRTQK